MSWVHKLSLYNVDHDQPGSYSWRFHLLTKRWMAWLTSTGASSIRSWPPPGTISRKARGMVCEGNRNIHLKNYSINTRFVEWEVAGSINWHNSIGLILSKALVISPPRMSHTGLAASNNGATAVIILFATLSNVYQQHPGTGMLLLTTLCNEDTHPLHLAHLHQSNTVILHAM